MTLELAKREEKTATMDGGDQSSRSTVNLGVYQAISAVQMEIAKAGIEKLQQNKFDNYKFRGIDDVYNHLAPILAKHRLCILPRMMSRACEERATQKGGSLFYVTVSAQFDFVSAADGSKHTVSMFGEAMDRGDKATNKAMSAAYKYACFQTFCIPTEGDNDADANSPEVKTKDAVPEGRGPDTKKQKPSKETQTATDSKKEEMPSKPSNEPTDSGTMSPAQQKAIQNLARRRGIKDEDLEQMCHDQYGVSLKDLPSGEASAFIKHLQKSA